MGGNPLLFVFSHDHGDREGLKGIKSPPKSLSIRSNPPQSLWFRNETNKRQSLWMVQHTIWIWIGECFYFVFSNSLEFFSNLIRSLQISSFGSSNPARSWTVFTEGSVPVGRSVIRSAAGPICLESTSFRPDPRQSNDSCLSSTERHCWEISLG